MSIFKRSGLKSARCCRPINVQSENNDYGNIQLHTRRFQIGSRGQMVPRMRRPRSAERRATRHARNRRCARHVAQPVRLHFGHRLLVALHLLYEDLRVPHDPRPRQCRGHGRQGRQSRPERLGLHRRRRLAGHRRQPLHPRHPAQRRSQLHPLQQRDLRTDQRAVLAHDQAGQGHQDLALRHDRKAVQSRRTGHRRQGDLLRPHGGRRRRADQVVPAGRRTPSGDVGGRMSGQLRDLQQ